MTSEVSNNNLEDKIKTIKSFLNNINDLLYKLKSMGYDTSEIYKAYDILRYEVLSDEYIKLIEDSDLLDDFINKINIYNSLLNDLVNQLGQMTGKLEAYDDFVSKKEKPKRKVYGMQITNLLNVIATSVVLCISGFIEKSDVGDFSSPTETIYIFDTFGRYDKSDSKTIGDGLTIISEYSNPHISEKTGKKVWDLSTYHLEGSDISTINQLKRVDLSGLTPVSIEEVGYNMYNKNYDHYRHCKIKYELEHSYYIRSRMFYALCFVLLMDLGWTICDFSDGVGYTNYYQLIFGNLIELVKYKQAMKKYSKDVSLSEEEREKTALLINKICQRIDKTVITCTEELSKIDSLKKYKKVREAKEAEEKLKATEDNKNKLKNEKIRKITEIITALSNELSSFSDLSEYETKKIYHSIRITSDVLFEEENDHLKIRSMFIPILKFLDLSTISFDNVDVRYIDFRWSNAVVNLRKVHNQDASYAKFDDRNISDWNNYFGVNLSGTLLSENPDTMIDLDKAIIDENTKFVSDSSLNQDIEKGYF